MKSDRVKELVEELSELLTEDNCDECPYLHYCRDVLYDRRDITICTILMDMVVG